MMLLMILTIVILSPTHSFYQSFITLSSLGHDFQPQNPVQLLLETTFVSQSLCSATCNQQPSCHTFDYDSTSGRCRLFEGDLTTGLIVSSASVTSIVGISNLLPSLFVQTHNQSCQACQEDRYEICSTTTNICQCRSHTFWNGSVCLLQLLVNNTCYQIDACRADLNLTCVTDSYGQYNKCSTVDTTSTTTVPSTTTSTLSLSSTCSASVSGGMLLHNFTGQAPSGTYQNYTFNFTATSATSAIVFGFSAAHNNGWFLDNVSVRDAGSSNSTELVANGDFSTGNLTDWIQLCSMNCSGPATRGKSGVITSGCASGSAAPCYYAECDPTTYVFLVQSLVTTSGSVYQLLFSMAVNTPAATSMFVSIA